MNHPSETQAIQRKTGDLYADCWDELRDDQWLVQGELLADQLGLTTDHVRGLYVFDGGCGHGALDHRIATMSASEVVGFDLNPNIKPERFASTPNAQFVSGSLLDIPFPDASFDLVVSSGVIHHTVDPERCFREMARILKPGQRLVLGVYGKYGLFPWCLWIVRLFTVRLPLIRESFIRRVCDWLNLDPIWRYQVLDYLYVPILRRFTPSAVQEMFRRAGFTDVARISNITPEKGKSYTRRQASYSYDYRALSSRILFGHGFIVTAGRKQ